MQPETKKAFEVLNLNRVWLPTIIGMGIAAYLFWGDNVFTRDSMHLLGQANGFSLLFAVLMIVVRDLGYIYRLRIITQQEMSWVSSFYIIVLWEFSSAVTPSVVGGGLVAVFLMAREGLTLGKAVAYVMLTAILDNLFFVLAAPAGYFVAYDAVFSSNAAAMQLGGRSLQYIFWISYGLVTLYMFNMLFALFFKPRFFKWLLLRCTKISFLKRWKNSARTHGDEIMLASQVLKNKPFSYWGKLLLVTAFAWSSRYIILNFLMAAYVPLDIWQHVIIFGKHIMLWVVMLISPTPGSSGTAEFFFKQLYQSELGEYTLITDLVWRLLTYYLYLVLGIIYLPRWVKKIFVAQKEHAQ
jgi:uncharacterized membrane protein YbhN (UPF0104 family)